MKSETSDAIRDRRQAFKLFDKGFSPAQILKRIARSSAWLFKWKKRFEQAGWAALAPASRVPKHRPQKYPPGIVKLVLRIRQRLAKASAGLSGPKAIQEELRRQHRLRPLPALATIKRWLAAARPPAAAADKAKPPYYPAPRQVAGLVIQSCDWIARYLPGGVKVFAFHTVDWESQALSQTLRRDKSTPTACLHLLESGTRVGLPDLLQLDNDAAFTGLGYTPRVFGQFVRLALYLGIELLFIPPGEPKRNWLVEQINGLWARSFWNKNHFATWRVLLRKSPRFLAWYQRYAPPALGGLTVGEASRRTQRVRLKLRQRAQLPEVLPLTAGRLHFIRRVSPMGQINLLKEDWPVSRRLAGQYVWATLDLGRRELRIYYRRSARASVRLLRTFAYEIKGPVQPLLPEYRRRARRIEVRKLL